MKQYSLIPRALLLLLPISLAGCTRKVTPAESEKPSNTSSGVADVVTMSATQRERAGVRTAMVESMVVPVSLSITGKVSMDESHTAHIGALADGIVEKVLVLPGDQVRSGQVLAHIHSHLIHETAAALAQAYAESEQKSSALQFAEQARKRYSHLYAIQAASLEEDQRSEQAVFQAQKDLRVADANVRQEREHLAELLQISPETINRKNIFDFEDVPVRTPIRGVIVSRNITPATVVQAGTEAFLVTDMSTVWVTGAVNEKDISSIRLGIPVQVKVQGYGEELFRGHIGQIGTTLDTATRTIPIRIVVPNSDLRLKPEMFVSASIEGHNSRSALMIPEEAVQQVNGVPVVFVQTGLEQFRVQAVSLGSKTQGKIEVTQGVKPDEHIVTSGAFMMKSALLKSAMEGQ